MARLRRIDRLAIGRIACDTVSSALGVQHADRRDQPGKSRQRFSCSSHAEEPNEGRQRRDREWMGIELAQRDVPVFRLRGADDYF